MDNKSLKNGVFLIFIRKNTIRLIFNPYINLPDFTIKAAIKLPNIADYKALSDIELNDLLGEGTQVIYQTQYFGESNKDTLKVLMLGIIAGLSTHFGVNGAPMNCLGSTSYAIIDALRERVFVSLYHKESNLNTYGIEINPLMLNNMLEASHYANANRITPMTEDYCEQKGWDHLNCIEVAFNHDSRDKPITAEHWIAFKPYTTQHEHVFSCYICQTVTNKKCPCWDGKTTTQTPPIEF